MKKFGILAVIMLLGVSSLIAQNTGGRQGRNFDPKERAKQEVERMDEKLDLNKDQQEKVYEILLDVNNKMVVMRKEMMNGGGNRDAMREKMMQMRSDQNKELKKVFSDEQWTKYNKMMEERRKQFGRGQGGAHR